MLRFHDIECTIVSEWITVLNLIRSHADTKFAVGTSIL
jgi:hypothetical protein